VVGRRDDPATLLLAGWLSARFGVEVPVEQAGGRAPGVGGIGVSEVTVELVDGGIVRLSRRDAASVVLQRSEQHDSEVALPERQLGDLLAEELRRLDADQPFADALAVAAGVPGLADRPDEPRTLIWVDPMASAGTPVAAQSSVASPAAVASSAAAGGPSSAASTTEAAAAEPAPAAETDVEAGGHGEGTPRSDSGGPGPTA
jgi:hypothetical protein